MPTQAPIKLVNLNDLQSKSGALAHSQLKGFTQMIRNYNGEIRQYSSGKIYQLYLLFGLPRIEFEAVLAHELLHVWIYENDLDLSSFILEGFCNLGADLIYNNDSTKFSQIHLKALAENKHPNYGEGYLFMKKNLEKSGWKNLLKNLASIEK